MSLFDRMAESCKTPGMKIRSKGKGRGLARGQGKGPMGKPAGDEMTEGKGGAAGAIRVLDKQRQQLNTFRKHTIAAVYWSTGEAEAFRDAMNAADTKLLAARNVLVKAGSAGG